MLKSWCRRLGVAACLLAVTGVAGAQSQSSDQSAAPAEDTVVATIDGEPIHMSEVELAFQSLPAQYRNLPMPMIFGALLQQIIDRRLVADAAEAADMDEEPTVSEQLALARRSVLQQAYLSRQVEPELTDEKLRARYEEQIASKPGEEEVSARHILVETEEEARDVLNTLRGGKDFAEVAKEKSIGPSGPRGGDLGFFAAGDMVPEFSEAAFKLQPGELSEPVKSEFGWHIIRVDERRTQPAPSFEESVDELRQQVAKEVVAAEMARLREKAEIETFNPDGTPQVAPGGGPPAARE